MKEKKPSIQKGPSYLNFDQASYTWKADVDYRQNPDKYKVGKGEQGVLICEPYKSEIGPHWRFKNIEIAEQSAAVIFQMFLDYLSTDEFVGADLARKYLQMGYTRARRYANYKGGKKYNKSEGYTPLERGTGAEEKAKAAAIFYDYWKKAEDNQQYKNKKIEWKLNFG